MALSPQLKSLFNYLYNDIKQDAEHEVKVLRGDQNIVTGHMKYRSVLQRYLTSEEAVEAFGKVLEMFGQSVINEVMHILDGEDADGHTFALTDSKTGEVLYPGGGYFDEWMDFAYVRDEGIEE